MKIAIDYTPVEQAPVGIGQYTLSLCSELIQQDDQNQYFIYSTKPILLAGAQNIVVSFPRRFPLKGVRWMLKVSKDLKRKKVDILISPSNHLFALIFPKTIQFIHDLAPVFYPQFFSKKFALFYKFTAKLVLKKAWHVVTVSQSVKQELQNHTKSPMPISVLYPGVNKWITDRSVKDDAVLQKYDLNPGYLLTVSTLEPRKNIINLIKAYHLFKQKHNNPPPLVIVGKKGWLYNEIFKTIIKLGLSNNIIFLGYVPNQHLSAIYNASKAFIFLSHYEGFGMPPLEALYLNIPTLLSDIAVFKECFSGLASFCDKDDPTQIALALEQILIKKHNDTRSQIQQKFSWQNSATQLLAIINANK